MRLATLILLATAAGCAGSSARPPEKPATAPPVAPTTTTTPPPSVAGVGRTCPAPLATPFVVVPQNGMGGTAELQFSKDGRIAAAKASGLEIQLWNVTSGNKVASIAPGTAISQWSLRPDGRMIAFIADGQLELVEPTSRAAPRKVTLPANVERLDWRADGKSLFATRGQETSVVDAAGAVTATIAAVSAPGGISADGRFLFSRDGAMWDVATNQSRWKAAAPASSVAFSDDGQAIALATSSRTASSAGAANQPQAITVFDAATGAKRWEIATKGGLGSEIVLSPDGQSVAAYDDGEYSERGVDNRGMAVWNRGKRVHLWQAADAVAATRAGFSPDGKTVGFVASGNGTGPELRLADARTGARVKQVKNTGDVRAEPPHWSADARTILQATNNGLAVFDVVKGDRRLVGKSTPEAAGAYFRDAVWSPDDGALLVVVDQGARSLAAIVDLKTGTLRDALDGRAGGPTPRRYRSAEWNAATGIIALDRGDGVALWDGRAKQPLRVIDTGDGDNVDRQIAFSPQGNLLATLSPSAKEVKLWDVKTGAKVRSLTVAGRGAVGEDGTPYPTLIEGMAFSADGTRIALGAVLTSGAEQSTHIAIFETTSGALVRTLHAPRSYGYAYGVSYGKSGALHFTPQGRGIVAIGGAGRVDLWSTAADDPPTPLLEKAMPGPSTLADSGNLLVMGSPTLAVWDLRTRSLVRELPGDGSAVLGARAAKGAGAIAVTRPDHVDLHRLADRASLSLRMAAASATPGVVIAADNGAYSGAPVTGPLRVHDGAEPDVRSLRPNEATMLYRPSLALDFVAGCPQ